MTVHATRRLKVAVLAGCTFVTVAAGGVLLASRLRDQAEFVAGIATFMGALLFGCAWLWWPRPRIKLPRRRASSSRSSPSGCSLKEIRAHLARPDGAETELHQ